MKPQIARRVFVGSIAVGGTGAVLGLGSLALAQARGRIKQDPVLTHLEQELKRLARELHNRPQRLSHGRVLADHLRLLNRWVLDHDYGTALRQKAARAVARMGRSAIIAHASGPEMAQHRQRILQEAGIDYDAPLPADWNGYEEQLTILLTRPNALSQRLAQLALAAEEAVERREAAGGQPVTLVALNQVPECRQFCDVMEYVVAILCAIVLFDPVPGDEAICAVLTVAVSVYCLLTRWVC